MYQRTDLCSFLAAFPLEGRSLLFLTRLHRGLLRQKAEAAAADHCRTMSRGTEENVIKSPTVTTIITQ